MDQAALSSKSVLQTLIKTNRPPTDEETAIILESMAPTHAKLKVVEAQISDAKAHIQALKARVEQAESKLQRLHEEEAAILETFADHRRIFAPYRNLPEDVLRAICVTCVEGEIPKLSYLRKPMPYVLAQICSGMRHVALTTPIIWASMHVEMCSLFLSSLTRYELAYSDDLARRARTWFERAGQLPLTILIQDDDRSYAAFKRYESDPSSILFDTLFKFSTRWKEIQVISRSGDIRSPPMNRIAALTAVDVPQLQSVSLRVSCITPDSELHNSVLLTIPTLKYLKLETYSIQTFTVNWAILTSITLRGISYSSPFYSVYQSRNLIAGILQQTKCLAFCNIGVRPDYLVEEHYSDKINLPFLKTLIISEEVASNGAGSILDLITAPILEMFYINKMPFDFAGFFQRSPCIWKLSLPYNKDKSLANMMGFLRHCPSLTVLFLWRASENWGMGTYDANRFLRAFVEEGNAGILCPRLQHFDFKGNIDFSLQTLRLFLDGKQGEILMPDVLRWIKVAVDITGINAVETQQQMLDLVSQKKTAGLDVRLRGSQY